MKNCVILLILFTLSSCVSTVVDSVYAVGKTAVSGVVDVTTGVVSTTADIVSGDEDEEDDDYYDRYDEEEFE